MDILTYLNSTNIDIIHNLYESNNVESTNQLQKLAHFKHERNATTKIIIDSGASKTVFCTAELLDDYTTCQELMFTTASGHQVYTQGKGKFKIQLDNHTLEIDAYHLPDISINLLSVNDFCIQNAQVQFEDDYWYTTYKGKRYQLGARDKQNNLYYMDNKTQLEIKHNQPENNIKEEINSMERIFNLTDDDSCLGEQYIVDNTKPLTLYDHHLMTNHMPLHKLKQLIQQGQFLTKLNDQKSIQQIKQCKHCKMINSKKASHKHHTQRKATRRLQRIHSDLMGPFRIDLVKYYTTSVIDEYSNYATTIVSDTRSVQIAIMRELKQLNNKFPGERITNFRADNAREMPNKSILADEGITKEDIPPYSPAMNGIAEAYNKLLLTQIKHIVMNHPGYYNRILTFFPEMVEWATYTRNHTPTDRVEDRKGCTPYELMYNQQYIPKFQQFGIDVIIHITCVEEATTFGVKLNKTRPPIVLGFIVGYGNDSNTYLVQTIGNKPARKYTSNITILNTMDNIKTYLNNLDSQQVEEASNIAEQLRDYDDPNFRTDQIPLQQEIPPEEDFKLYKQLVDETGITEIYDFFESPMTYINSTMLQQLTRETPDINKILESSYQEPSPIRNTNPTPNPSDLINEISYYPNSKDWLLDLENPIDFTSANWINKLCSSNLSTNRGEFQSIGEIQLPNIEELNIQEIEIPVTGNNSNTKKHKNTKTHTAIALQKIPKIHDNLQKLMKQPTFKVPQLLEHNTLQLDSIEVSKNTAMEKRSNGWKMKGRISKLPVDELGKQNSEIIHPPTYPMINLTTVEDEETHSENIYAVERYVDLNDENWKEAMQAEMDKFDKMNVYDVVDIPRDKKLIPAKWVHTYKVDSLKGQSYKSRCVVQGFRQIAGIDFDPSRILSPVTDLMTIRVLTVIACELNYEIHHVDITAAYLNALLPKDQPIYVKPPQGVDIEPGRCWRLNKSVYGLRQSGFEWYLHITSKLEKLGLNKCQNHDGLYMLQNDKGTIFVTLYVDDLFIATSLNQMFNEFHDQLEKEFQLNYLGHIREYLGVEFTAIEGGYRLTQRSFADQLVKTFELQNCYGRDLPRPSSDSERYRNKDIPTDDEFYEKEEHDKLDDKATKVFQKGVGMLQWLTMNTRPDISYAVNALGIKASSPTTEDYKMLLHCIEYIKKHPDTGLTYVRGKTSYLGPDFVVYGYADASFAPPDNRKSVSGYCTYINGNLVQWGTKKQRCVASSSMAAEIIDLGEAVSRSTQVISILRSLQLKPKKLLIFEDNQPTIKVVNNRKTLSRKRTIDITMEVLRYLINEAREVDITYINTNDNIADGFTKALGIKKFSQLTGLLFDDGNLQQISQEIVARLYGNTRDTSVIYNVLWGEKISWDMIYLVMGIRGETPLVKDGGTDSDRLTQLEE